jgi:hypothetical protein
MLPGGPAAPLGGKPAKERDAMMRQWRSSRSATTVHRDRRRKPLEFEPFTRSGTPDPSGGERSGWRIAVSPMSGFT